MSGKWHVPYAVIFLTNNCNLACSYCFASRTGQLSMSRRTAERSVEWLFENTEGFPENPLILSFFGGEPLLEFGLMKAVVEHAGALSQKYGKSMIFSLTTNGTLLTDEMLDFIEKHNISMLFSIDGDRQTNDRFRLKKNGTSPFDTLCTNARKVLRRFPNTAARMTITPESAGSVFNNILFLERLGFSFISPCVALELFLDHDDWKTFDAECRRIAGYIIEKASEGEYLHLHFLDNGIQQIVEKQPVDVACGAGKTFVGIDAEGAIYPCHRFVTYAGADKEKFRLGDVFKGIDPVRTLPFRRYDKTHILGCYTRCNECPAKDFCAGGCIALHQEINGLFTMPLLQQQKLMTIWHSICNETIEAFKEMDRYDFLLEQIRMKPKSFVPVND
jgi:uncharacterized protein